MKIAIFGATGGTGRALVKQALAAGDSVRALVRNPTDLDVQHENLTVVPGDVQDVNAVRETIRGTQAVLCSLGNTANNPDFIVSKGTAVILDAMRELDVKRIVVVSSMGVGDSRDQVGLLFKIIMKTVLRKVMQDKERQEKMVKESGLNWTIVRPAGLNSGPKTERYVHGTDPEIQSRSISRADVADFVLKQLRYDNYVQQTPAVVGPPND